MTEKLPYVTIPKDRELDDSERRQLVNVFKERYMEMNPGASQWTLDRAANEFATQVVQASPGLQAFDAQMSAKQAERDKAAQAEAQRQAQRVQAARDANLETERRRLLADWCDNGGDEQTFNERWPELRIKIVEGKTLGRHNQRLAQTAQTWRG